MKLSDLTNHAGEWLRGNGPMSEIVISSRIRLARNVAGFPFLTRCTRHQRQAARIAGPRNHPQHADRATDALCGSGGGSGS